MLYGEKLREICEKLGINSDKLENNLYGTLLNEICEKLGIDQDKLENKLYGTLLDEICDKLGIDQNKIENKLYSTLLDEICNCCGSGGGSSEMITDLTGTTWYFNETIDIASLNTIAQNTNGNNYLFGINFSSDGITNGDYLEARVANNQLGYGGSPYGESNVYNESRGWTEKYRTIAITGGKLSTNSDLIAWFNANATQVE